MGWFYVALVGNGFAPEVHRALFKRFRGLETDDSLSRICRSGTRAAGGTRFTAEKMKECRWLKPKLVAIEYAE